MVPRPPISTLKDTLVPYTPLVRSLGATGVCGGIGHWMLIIAHRYAPASLLSPFSYSGILWMTASGYLVFGDLPDEWTVIGGAGVIASGLYVVHRARLRKVGGCELPAGC